MDLSVGQWTGLGLSGALLYAIACINVAARRLGRLERRAWAEGRRASEATDPENGSNSSESAMLALGLGRQLALVWLVVQVVGVVGPATGSSLAVDLCLAMVAWVVVDRLLPSWSVGLAGSERVLSIGRPMVWLVRMLLGSAATYLVRVSSRARLRPHEEERTGPRSDLGAFLDMAEEEGMMSESDEAILRGFADFEETVAREVMTPRVDVIAIDAAARLADLRRLIAEHKLSRIPVIREDLDHVVGVVHLKDLVAALEEGGEGLSISEITRAAWFVPETKRVSDLLQEFQQRQVQMAIVVDEYGGTAGLVTLEDVVEEIVGEIQDESEELEELIQEEAGGGAILASGKAEIEDVEEALALEVPDGEFHTVGGMVFTHLGHVPQAGETFELGGISIEVLDADDRRINRVRIKPNGR